MKKKYNNKKYATHNVNKNQVIQTTNQNFKKEDEMDIMQYT